MNTTNGSVKLTLCQELKELLAQWDVILVTQAAAQRDYERLSNRITEICALLDKLDGAVR